ncbi:unnamed protein product [Polarella glacialis]|uniref:Uncharacterized protein n=1 Tax=Polarella glacialis TaxID=89957 RepID=A0A813FUM5_POLGL|nr:unnamed protein product [Polarella glacialis]
MRLNDIPFINTSVLLLFLPPEFWHYLARHVRGHVPKLWREGYSRCANLWCKLLRQLVPSLTGELHPNSGDDNNNNNKNNNGKVDSVTIKVEVFELELGRDEDQADGCANGKGGRQVSSPSSSRCYRWLFGTSCAAVAAFVAVYNVSNQASIVFGPYHWWNMPKWADGLAVQLRIDHNWAVFSPRPPTQDWYVKMPGQLRNYTYEVDVFRAMFGDFEKPFRPMDDREPDKIFSYVIANERWTKYLESLMRGWANDGEKQQRDAMRLSMGQFICREWNSRFGHSDDALVSFKGVASYMPNEEVRADLMAPRRRPVNQDVFWQHLC